MNEQPATDLMLWTQLQPAVGLVLAGLLILLAVEAGAMIAMIICLCRKTRTGHDHPA